MSEKLKIKLTIADRVYPRTVDPDQEEGLRKAAKHIESLIKQFEQNYAVRDKQDVLAMCALQFASKLEQKSIDKENTNAEAETRLHTINRLLQEQLLVYKNVL
ncbi:MAG: cell division protein ZapA [Sinomicrobium sp.]|nr:cell division protein ZapA [Sinomicrobium sp.]